MTDTPRGELPSGARFSEIKLFGRRSTLTEQSDGDSAPSNGDESEVYLDLKAGTIEAEHGFGLVLRFEWKANDVRLAIEAGQQVLVDDVDAVRFEEKREMLAYVLFPHVIGYALGWMADEARSLGVPTPELDYGVYTSLRKGLLDHINHPSDPE